MDCINTPVHSYNSQTFCGEVRKFVEPESEAGVQTAILEARTRKQPLRVVGKLHSTNSLLCGNGIVLGTSKLSRILRLEKVHGEQTVAVEPGATVGAVANWLAERGLSLGYAVPGYHGISIGGAMGTAAHGDSSKHVSVISSIVERVRAVDGQGQVREFSRATAPEDTFRALSASLGLLGVITKVNLRVRHQTNLNVLTSVIDDRFLFVEGGLAGEVEGCDYGTLHWYPTTGRVRRVCGKETASEADDGARYALLDPPATRENFNLLKVFFQLGSCFSSLNRTIESFLPLDLDFNAPYFKTGARGKPVPAKEVTGPLHRMIMSEYSAFGSSLAQYDYSVAIPGRHAARAAAWIKEWAKTNDLAFPIGGIAMRSVLSDRKTLLAGTGADDVDFADGATAIDIEFFAYHPAGFDPERLVAHQAPFTEMAETLVRDFHGRAHWGKNVEAVFATQREHRGFASLADRFRAVVAEMDPVGLFANDFARRAGLVPDHSSDGDGAGPTSP